MEDTAKDESPQTALNVATNRLQLSSSLSTPLTSPAKQPEPQTSSSATGNPRNKCALKPGHSLMDWVRLGTNSDLAGTRGVVRPISHDELSKHNKVNDAWIAIRGKVYNVTRYMDFHPGGVEELMKGVGRDATKIFDEVHAWVNYEQLLLKCFIGPLQNTATINGRDITDKTKSINQLASSTMPNGSFKAPFLPIFTADANRSPNKSGDNAEQSNSSVNVSEIVPRFDWIQNTNEITLVFYTKPMCNAGIYIKCPVSQLRLESISYVEYEISIQIRDTVHVHTLEFCASVEFPPISSKINYDTGKIEVIFRKCKPELWNRLGSLSRDKWTVDPSQITTLLGQYDVIDRVQITDDSYALVLKPLQKGMTILPIGYHVSVRALINDEWITRNYTPIPKSFMPSSQCQTAQYLHLFLLVKSYASGKMSPYITDEVPFVEDLIVSFGKGNFQIDAMVKHSHIAILAAGSGLTPMLPIIEFLLERKHRKLEKLNMFYFNKTENDIWCKNELSAMVERDERFQVQHILSQPIDNDGAYECGRMSNSLASRLFDTKSDIHSTYCLICGPYEFYKYSVDALRSVGYGADQIHVFK